MTKTLKIQWDTSLPPITPKSPEEEEIARWDEWFTLAGIKAEWDSVKKECSNLGLSNSYVIEFARILEINRLHKLSEPK